jgi:hypothetical protein
MLAYVRQDNCASEGNLLQIKLDVIFNFQTNDKLVNKSKKNCRLNSASMALDMEALRVL